MKHIRTISILLLLALYCAGTCAQVVAVRSHFAPRSSGVVLNEAQPGGSQSPASIQPRRHIPLVKPLITHPLVSLEWPTPLHPKTRWLPVLHRDAAIPASTPRAVEGSRAPPQT